MQANILQESEPVYDEHEKVFTNYDEKYQAKLYAAENLHSNSNFSIVIFVKKYFSIGFSKDKAKKNYLRNRLW